MSQIATTRLGTSDNGSLCKGFALFPSIGTTRAGISVSDQTEKLIDARTSLLVFRYSVTAGYQLFFGLCGPAYGIAFNIEGTTQSDNTAEFTLANSYLEAGFFMGATLRLFLDVKVENYAVRWIYDGWSSRFEGYWRDAFSFSLDFNLDLIAITFEILQRVLQGKGAQLKKIGDGLDSLGKTLPSIQGTFAMIDSDRSDFAEKGTATVTPSLDIPINIVSLIPQLHPAVTGLEKLGGCLEVGPLLSLQVPVTVGISQVMAGNKAYDPRTSAGAALGDNDTPAVESVIKAVGSDMGTAASDDPGSIGVKLTHKAGFDIGIGFFFKIGIAKVFELNSSGKIPVLDKLGIKIETKPHDNSLSNTIGGKLAQAGIPGANLPRDAYAAVENALPQAMPEIRLKRVAFRPKTAPVTTAGREALTV